MMPTNPPPAQPTTPGKRALLIGINKYDSSIAVDLGGCISDVLAMRSFLTDRLGVPGDNIQLVLAAKDGDALPAGIQAHRSACKADIEAAFTRLIADTVQGDEVVVHYSGHGVRLSLSTNRNEKLEALAPQDLGPNGENALVDRELNGLIRQLTQKGAVLTIIIDGCHSGGATRAMDVATRGIEQELVIQPAAWRALSAADSPGSAATVSSRTSASRAVGGWLPGITIGAQDLIVLSSCRTAELSHEFRPEGLARRGGALTFELLTALEALDPEKVRAATWSDLFPTVRDKVQVRFNNQHPTLEGHGERPLFGGAWQLFEPGFLVTKQDGEIQIAAGEAHDVTVGAKLEIYPPGTSSFERAKAQGVQPAEVEITWCNAVQSRGRQLSGPPIVPNSRATITAPSPALPKLRVLLNNLPAGLVKVVTGAAESAAFLTFVPPGTPADVEVYPWLGGGYVLVSWQSVPRQLTTNDVIAYLHADGVVDQAILGDALAAGLVHWARYRALINRQNEEPILQDVLEMKLLVTKDSKALAKNPEYAQFAAQPDASGEYHVTGVREDDNTNRSGESDAILLRVINKSNLRNINVGVLLCSDDGNVNLLWPPLGSPDTLLRPNEVITVGLEGANPFVLSVRRDQTRSHYFLKLFASEERHALDLESMQLHETVQEIIDAKLGSVRGETGATRAGSRPRILWTTLQIPIVAYLSTEKA